MVATLEVKVYPPGIAEGQKEAWPHNDVFEPEEYEATLPLPEERCWASKAAETQAIALQDQATIHSLLDPRLKLKRPIAIALERENEFYIASCNEFEEFGYGYDPTQAIDDLRQTLAELYWTLKEDQDRLSPHLARLWNRLQRVIEEA